MGEKINKVQIDFSKIYNDEYAAASGSGSHSVSEKNQEYWGNEGTQLEIVEVEADGQKVYRIDEIQADGSRVGMGFTTEDGIIQSVDSQNTPSDQNQNESHIKEDDAAQGDSGSSSKITEQQDSDYMPPTPQQEKEEWIKYSEQVRKNSKLKAKLPDREIYVDSNGTEYTFKNGIINSINPASEQNQDESYITEADATQGDSGSSSKTMTIEEQKQSRANESTARSSMKTEAKQQAIEEVSQIADPISHNNTIVDASQFADPNNSK